MTVSSVTNEGVFMKAEVNYHTKVCGSSEGAVVCLALPLSLVVFALLNVAVFPVFNVIAQILELFKNGKVFGCIQWFVFPRVSWVYYL